VSANLITHLPRSIDFVTLSGFFFNFRIWGPAAFFRLRGGVIMIIWGGFFHCFLWVGRVLQYGLWGGGGSGFFSFDCV